MSLPAQARLIFLELSLISRIIYKPDLIDNRWAEGLTNGLPGLALNPVSAWDSDNMQHGFEGWSYLDLIDHPSLSMLL